MTAADRLAEALLRLAARRWPAEVREEQAREWAAELHALRAEPGSAGRRALGQLRFAFSLAAASPVEDEDGVPRGWREGLPEVSRALRPIGVLVLFGVLAAGPAGGVLRTLSEWLLGLAGVEITWPAGTAVTVGTSVPPLLVLTAAAWWLGRRMQVGLAGLRRLGAAGPAAAAPAALAVAFALLVVGAQSAGVPDGGALAVSLCAGAVAWAVLAAALAVAVVRVAEGPGSGGRGAEGRGARRARRSPPAGPAVRWLLAAAVAVVGVPLVVELAVAAAALPWMLVSGAGAGAALGWAPMLVSGTAWTGPSWTQTPDGIALLNATNAFPSHLLLLTSIAIGYGLGAAHPRAPRPVAAPAGTPAPLRLPAPATVAGAVGLAGGLLAWAYTLAVLTPAMPLVGQTAPMPGGDGELYMWVAELRWAGIALAALGLLLAAADRRAVAPAAAAQTVLLLVADGVLARAGVTGPGGLRTALTAAAVAAVLSWRVAGRRHKVDPLVARRRLGWTALTAACCGPILFGQGTPTVNHPFLPAGLAATTAVLAAAFAVVAVHAAAAARQTPLSRTWLASATIAPALLLGAAGAATGAGVPNHWTEAGVLLAAPMMVLAAAILRGPRRGRARTAVWTTVVLASPALSVPVVAGSLMLSIFVANVLFVVAGSSWAADGLALLPGAVVLAAVAGAAVARWVIRPEAPSTDPAVPPVPPTDPQPGATQPSPAVAEPQPGATQPPPALAGPQPSPADPRLPARDGPVVVLPVPDPAAAAR
ncbi:hypothetical protein AB0H83_39890 [Dactylosporangium sp. NPDC050688]|uniref:hypothetical protein n=1 Tax=Dactylosporangium sp. NPDC050688 TaxID=3157217 RepID=UPI0033C3213E